MTSDDGIWHLYAKGVKKIGKAKAGVHTPRRGKAEHSDARSHKIGLAARSTVAEPVKPITLDRRVEKNLRLGEIVLEARIDLHGMTQTEAYDALARFMVMQVKAGKRNLLIITGKGKLGGGVLRTNLPDWLQSLPEAKHILTLRPAAVKHGGSGAFYVLLKKKKDRN